ncbi:DUF4307 domain-containing protein [Salinifilum aidingensis]
MSETGVREDRYGSRARRRPRPVLRWLLTAAALVVLLVLSIVAYRNFGNAPIEAEQVAFDVRDDGHVHVTVQVRRDDPSDRAECVVRARAESGREVGRKEIVVPPAEGAVVQGTTLRTSARATIGEVYGCTYNVPEYLSTQQRPIG